MLFAVSAMGQCVNFIDDPSYCRTGLDFWPITGSTNAWDLYHNGVFQSTEVGGSASIDFYYATPKREIKVGICDNSHGIALDWLVTNVAPGCRIYRSTPDSTGIRDCTTNGCHVINCSFFTAAQGQPANDLSNACYEASQAGVIVVASVPNGNQSIDTTPALPASLNIPLLIPVTSSTRQDTVFNPAAWGSNVIAAPGRVILTQDINGNPVYASGTSYAAPMVAGVIAWLLGQFDQSPATIVQAIRRGSVPIDSRILGRLSMRGAVEALRPTMQMLSVAGLGSYVVEQSEDFANWNYFGTVTGDSQVYAIPGFYRAKVK